MSCRSMISVPGAGTALCGLSRFSPFSRLVRVPRTVRVCRASGVLLLVLLVASCSGAEPPEPASPAEPELPQLAQVGGVQDLWPFPFSFNVDRATVEAEYGPPVSITESQPVANSGAEVIEWQYPGKTFAFFSKTSDNLESLISVTITGPEVPLRGEISVGMPVSEAREVLGEPGVQTEEALVFFYSDTTIELLYENDIVTGVVLGRALP